MNKIAREIKRVFRKSHLNKVFGHDENFEICQLFINDGKVSTKISFTNFTSFSLLDNNDKKSKFKISLIDFSGKELANKKISLSKFTSKAIDVKELFNEIITPEYGLIPFSIYN